MTTMLTKEISTRGTVNAARIAVGVRALVMVAAGGTFIAFLVWDPEPSLVLSACVAANVALMSWMVHRLYQQELLLSVAASTLIGPGLIICYSLGNLGARIAGEGRYGSNPGSLKFYPLAALLSTMGLALFASVVFGVLGRQQRYLRVRYSDLYWRPWQAPAAALVAVALLAYLSVKYPFSGGFFRDVESDVDRWLSASQYFFVILGVTIGVSVTIRARHLLERLVGLSGLLPPILIAWGLRSRTFMGTVLIMSVLCAITLRPRRAKWILLGAVIAIVPVFAIGTVVKTVSIKRGTTAIGENLLAIMETNTREVVEHNIDGGSIDGEYRMAGLEYPAAILRGLGLGVEPMYGDGLVGGALSGLPNVLRPSGEWSERQAIARRFLDHGLRYGDSIGIPLTTGLAEWGPAGFLIYGIIGVYCVVVWRAVQWSPRLFVAYLMAGAAPGDLFWENAFFAVRAIGFCWLALLVLSPLLMPRWLSAGDTAMRERDG